MDDTKVKYSTRSFLCSHFGLCLPNHSSCNELERQTCLPWLHWLHRIHMFTVGFSMFRNLIPLVWPRDILFFLFFGFQRNTIGHRYLIRRSIKRWLFSNSYALQHDTSSIRAYTHTHTHNTHYSPVHFGAYSLVPYPQCDYLIYHLGYHLWLI